MNNLSLRVAYSALIVSSLMVQPGLFSSSFQWSGPASGGDWNTSGNWTIIQGAGTFPNSANDIASIDNVTEPCTVNISSPVTVGFIILRPPAGAFAITGSQITFSGQSEAALSGASPGVSFSVSNPLQLNSPLGVFLNSLTSSSATLSGIISGNNYLSYSSSGNGNLTLNGSNTYSGGTLFFSGQITLGNNAGLGTGSLTMSNGTTLALLNPISAANDITIRSGTGSFFVDSGATGTLSGAITGGGGFAKTGTGTLVITSGSNSYSGATTVSAGNLFLSFTGTLADSSGVAVASGATFSISGLSSSPANITDLSGAGSVNLGSNSLTLTNPVSTFSGGIAGTGGSLTKQGSGTFTLSGTSSYTGSTTVSGGRLSVNGQISSPVTVESGAILGGIGTILDAVTIQNGAVLRPGNSIGTLTMSSLNLNQTSNTQIELSPDQNSLLEVTGIANLDGTLSIIFDDTGTSYKPKNYTILNASTVNGTFSLNPLQPGFNGQLAYLSNAVIFQLLSITADLAVSTISGDAAIFGNYINSLPEAYIASVPGLQQILVFDLSDPFTGIALEDVLSSMNPSRNSDGNFALQNTLFASMSVFSNRLSSQRIYLSSYAPKTAVSFESSRPFKENELTANADDRVMIQAKTPKERYAVWVNGFGEFSRQRAQDQNPAFHMEASGIFLGFDFFGERSLVGLAAGYAPTSIRESENAGRGTVDSYLGAIYGTGYFDQFYLEMALLGSYNHFSNKRNVVIPTFFTATARSEHNGGSITPHLGFGYDYTVAWATIEPYAVFNYNYNIESGYQERGAAPLNMAVKRRNSSMLRSELGMNFYQETKVGNGTFIAREQLAWVNKKPFHIGKTTSAFIGAPDFFTTTVLNSTQNLFSPALQLYYQAGSGFFLSATYEGEFGNGYDSNTILGKLGYAF